MARGPPRRVSIRLVTSSNVGCCCNRRNESASFIWFVILDVSISIAWFAIEH